MALVGRDFAFCDAELYTVTQVAKNLGVSEATVRMRVVLNEDPKTHRPICDPETGEPVPGCPCVRIGRQILISGADLNQWHRTNTVTLGRSTWPREGEGEAGEPEKRPASQRKAKRYLAKGAGEETT